MRIKIKIKPYTPKAGSNGDGGGGGPNPLTPPGLPLAPAPSPSVDPAALSTSPPLLQPVRPPPPPVVKYTDEGPDDDDWLEEGDDGDCEKEEDDERKNWNQLLNGKRTYLRPPRDCFRCPDARPRTLDCQKPLLDLVQEYPENYIVQEMIKILSQRYVHFRRTRRDGSSFYRAFFFSYLENLGKMRDSQSEVTRLMEQVAMCRENFCRLKWDKAYFLNPEEYFSSLVSEFNHLVNSVAKGLTSSELYKRSLQEILSLRIISFLRLLAETEVRTREKDYKPFIPGKRNVLPYCWKELRPMDAKALTLPMRALTYALGIPLRLEIVGRGLTAGGLQVKRLDFFPRPEPGKGAFHIVQSYWSTTTTPEPLELGSGNLLSSDGTPLLTLLCRSDNCDILYRK